ncbi:FAD-dependent oxidoreductase [Micromonospora sp. NPDC049047]|uniref:NAD(P)/FAD-dependent oxidoreductase n=1 Tax=Micromonospora sp. NPDC049047 TaxID=3155645 RepID=UPI00340D85AF
MIGGGYAGVMAANRLTQRDDVAVTLINPRPTFVERIRLHQVVGGSDGAVVDYREVLAGGVRLVVDTVTRIDAAGRSVTLAAGGTVAYDYLVYAVGSGSTGPDVPGAAEFAYPIASLEQAQRLRSVVAAASTTAPVTVVGAGPTGIETAAELAEAGRTVTLVCGEVLGPYLHARGRRSVAKRLARLGVTVLDVPAISRFFPSGGGLYKSRGGSTSRWWPDPSPRPHTTEQPRFGWGGQCLPPSRRTRGCQAAASRSAEVRPRLTTTSRSALTNNQRTARSTGRTAHDRQLLSARTSGVRIPV